jgi:glycosyltransferase involved in cell wall biosynthesis
LSPAVLDVEPATSESYQMSSAKEPLVSVLTPVYNGGAYLTECIESVLAQTYSNFDYTIINNCSTDNTGAIAEEFARKDKRIRVYKNDVLLDVISNHNKAFSLLSLESRYCKIVSGDDWLFPDCLRQMVRVAETHPSAGLVGSYQLSGGGKDWRTWRIRWDEIPYSNGLTPGREVGRMHLLGGPYVFGSPTSLMYRADLVRQRERFYPNSTAEADTSACYACLQESDFGFVHQVLSFMRLHEQTMTARSKSLNAYESSRLSDLVEYGPYFLTPEEFRKRLQEVLADYYWFLAVSAFHFRDAKFWAYHRRRFAECRQRFSYARLASAIASRGADLLLNPKQTVEKLFRSPEPAYG